MFHNKKSYERMTPHELVIEARRRKLPINPVLEGIEPGHKLKDHQVEVISQLILELNSFDDAKRDSASIIIASISFAVAIVSLIIALVKG